MGFSKQTEPQAKAMVTLQLHLSLCLCLACVFLVTLHILTRMQVWQRHDAAAITTEDIFTSETHSSYVFAYMYVLN